MSNRACQHQIDWEHLSMAEKYYRENCGSRYIETPWIVDEDVASITTTSPEVRTSKGRLVGSAEQGFIQLWKNGSITEPGLYHSISPCFRDDKPDDLHEDQFMKLELFKMILPDTNIEHETQVMIDNARSWFRASLMQVSVEEISGGTFDIVSKKHRIELGSYGFRSCDIEGRGTLLWIYGTGLALPRFSRAMGLEFLFDSGYSVDGR